MPVLFSVMPVSLHQSNIAGHPPAHHGDLFAPVPLTAQAEKNNGDFTYYNLFRKRMENPQPKLHRGSDQFPLRLPDGMRERLKLTAAVNNRTMNAEIVARLEDWEANSKQWASAESVINSLADQRDRLSGEVESARFDLVKARQERDVAIANGQLLERMLEMLQKIDGFHKQDQEVLDEVETVTNFLESDALSIEVELHEDGPGFNAVGPGAVKSFLAKRMIEAVDRRMKAALALALKLHVPGRPTARAVAIAHELAGSDRERHIADICITQGADDAGALYEYVETLIDQADEQNQDAYRAALDKVVLRLFPGWAKGRRQLEDLL